MISTDELQAWISPDRQHGVNINSGVLNDICAELIAARAKIAAAEALADALRSVDAMFSEPRKHNAETVKRSVRAALTAWEAAQ